MAIVEALTELEARWLRQGEETGATIWTDSMSSIDAIFAPVISQPLALEAHNLILKLQRQGHPISLRWIPGHKDHTGNELADYLAKAGRSLPLQTPAPSLFTPPGLVKSRIREKFRKAWTLEWQLHTRYRHSRLMLPKPNLTELIPQGAPPLPISKGQLQLLIEIVTGHDLLGKHLVHWHEDQTPICRLCKKAEETYHHLIFDCESLCQPRHFHPCDPGVDPLVYFKQLLHFTSFNQISSLRQSNIT